MDSSFCKSKTKQKVLKRIFLFIFFKILRFAQNDNIIKTIEVMAVWLLCL